MKNRIVRRWQKILAILLFASLAFPSWFPSRVLLAAETSATAKVAGSSDETDKNGSGAKNTSTEFESLMLRKEGLPFGHGNTLPFQEIGLSSLKILVREFSADGSSYDYLSIAADSRIYPASITKLMTVLLVLEKLQSAAIKEDSIMIVTENDLAGIEGASTIDILPGEELRVIDLLYAVLLNSASDAVKTLSRAVADDPSAFILLMNEKAKALGMKDTHFVNNTGLHHDDHYSTPTDITILLKACLAFPLFKTISQTMQYDIPPTNMHTAFYLQNSLEYYEQQAGIVHKWIQGGKTGYEASTNYNLVSYREEGDKLYIIMTAEAPEIGQHIVDHEKLYEYMFTARGPYTLLKKGEIAHIVPIEGGKRDGQKLLELPLLVGESVKLSLPFVQDASKFKLSYQYSPPLKAPVAADSDLGYLKLIDTRGATPVNLLDQKFTSGKEIKQTLSAYLKDKKNVILTLIFLIILALFIYFFALPLYRRKLLRDARRRRQMAAYQDRSNLSASAHSNGSADPLDKVQATFRRTAESSGKRRSAGQERKGSFFYEDHRIPDAGSSSSPRGKRPAPNQNLPIWPDAYRRQNMGEESNTPRRERSNPATAWSDMQIGSRTNQKHKSDAYGIKKRKRAWEQDSELASVTYWTQQSQSQPAEDELNQGQSRYSSQSTDRNNT